MEKMLTPQDVADKLGVTVYRVHQLIRAKRLPATAYGRFYLISEADLAFVAERKPGRPKKEAAAESAAAPEAAPQTQIKPKMTAAKKKAIAEEQERRWRGEKRAKKGNAVTNEPAK